MSRLILISSSIKIWVSRVMLSVAVLSGISILIIMFTTVIDVSRRYLLNRPWQNTVELNETLLILVIFFAIAMTQVQRGHIRVEILTMRLKPEVQELLWLIGLILGFVLLLVMGIDTMKDALRAYEIKEFKFGGGTQIFYIWWAKFVIPACCWLFCIQLVVDMVKSVAVLLGIAPTEFKGRSYDRPSIISGH